MLMTYLFLLSFLIGTVALVEEEIEEEGEPVIVVDIAGGDDETGGYPDLIGEIVDEGIAVFKGRGVIESDETLPGLDVLQLFIDG